MPNPSRWLHTDTVALRVPRAVLDHALRAAREADTRLFLEGLRGDIRQVREYLARHNQTTHGQARRSAPPGVVQKKSSVRKNRRKK